MRSDYKAAIRAAKSRIASTVERTVCFSLVKDFEEAIAKTMGAVAKQAVAKTMGAVAEQAVGKALAGQVHLQRRHPRQWDDWTRNLSGIYHPDSVTGSCTPRLKQCWSIQTSS